MIGGERRPNNGPHKQSRAATKRKRPVAVLVRLKNASRTDLDYSTGELCLLSTLSHSST
jgi:hypothetical protein